MTTCRFCRGPIVSKRIDHMAQRGDVYVLIRNLPAEVCAQCSEVYLDVAASRCVDRALDEAPRADQHMEVPVVMCA
jgi:YgiT-type zinc finger domain-containing protein